MKPAKIAMFAVVALCLLMFFRGKVSGFSLREGAESAVSMAETVGAAPAVESIVYGSMNCAKCKGKRKGTCVCPK